MRWIVVCDAVDVVVNKASNCWQEQRWKEHPYFALCSVRGKRPCIDQRRDWRRRGLALSGQTYWSGPHKERDPAVHHPRPLRAVHKWSFGTKCDVQVLNIKFLDVNVSPITYIRGTYAESQQLNSKIVTTDDKNVQVTMVIVNLVSCESLFVAK